jgi:predicted aminopeptidase
LDLTGGRTGGRQKLWRWAGRGAAALAALVLLLTVATPLGRYLARAAWEEGKILAARQSIEALVADSTTDALLRAKLRLVLEARQFAVDSIGLPAGEVFTQFTQLERDTLVLVLSGSAQDALRPVLWRFPLVGALPYKGFFRLADAERAERELKEDGFDTYLRPASAFSTLGWFNDPLLSTTLAQDPVNLVNTVIHELTHNRYFAAGDAVFNESFANFVGARGAEWFFAARGDSALAARAAARWADDRLLAAFWASLFTRLDSAFRSDSGAAMRARRSALRDSLYAEARRELVDEVAPRFQVVAPMYAERVRLDNASLLARRIYLTDLEAFERVYAELDRNLVRTIDWLVAEHSARR